MAFVLDSDEVVVAEINYRQAGRAEKELETELGVRVYAGGVGLLGLELGTLASITRMGSGDSLTGPPKRGAGNRDTRLILGT